MVTDTSWEFSTCIAEFNETSGNFGKLCLMADIKCKSKPLGTEFTGAGCSVTGFLTALKIQHGKTEMASNQSMSWG
jgi:hypothetical protein